MNYRGVLAVWVSLMMMKILDPDDDPDHGDNSDKRRS